MKKTILTLIGIIITLSVVVYTLYYHKKEAEEVVDIFEKEPSKEESPKEEEVPNKLEENTITVDIKGMIANPGVYTVGSKTRVNDVIELAGGLLENADTSLINLAKIVTDEMTIIIYSKDEVAKKDIKDEPLVCDCPVINNDACLNGDKESEGQININTASKEELLTIEGIGASKADSIIKYREENGPFKVVEDIKNVSGIGEALFEKIKALIAV